VSGFTWVPAEDDSDETDDQGNQIDVEDTVPSATELSNLSDDIVPSSTKLPDDNVLKGTELPENNNPMERELPEENIPLGTELPADILQIVNEVFDTEEDSDGLDFDLSIFSRIGNSLVGAGQENKIQFKDALEEELGLGNEITEADSKDTQFIDPQKNIIEFVKDEINNLVKPEKKTSEEKTSIDSQKETTVNNILKFPDSSIGLIKDTLSKFSVPNKKEVGDKKEAGEGRVLFPDNDISVIPTLESPLMNVVSLFDALGTSPLEKEGSE